MKKILIISITGFLFILFIPYLIVHFGCKTEKNSGTVSVYVADEDIVREMNVTQYLKEVTAAEMPAEFYEEALKAQAVAARTYLESRKAKHFDEHKGAVVCTDYKHCKAWMSEEKRRSLWEPDKADEYWKKISKAVEDTEGELIMYNGEAIDALFHSTSSGYTENAADVWGREVPYLISVKSEGDELSPRFESEKTVTKDEFISVVSGAVENTDWSGELFSDIERSEAGGIKTIVVGGVKIKGTELRTIFDLRSTNIELTCDEEKVCFKVKGNGHGVGMSQYGANYMASEGYNYKEILAKYYTNIEILKK